MKSADDIAQITTEIQIIDDQVESLRKQQLPLIERRLHLCAELNAVQSITCSMPAEILSHIIYTLIRDPYTYQSSFVLPPSLVWPVLAADRSNAHLMSMVPFIQLFYKNSGSLPVDLSLYSSSWDPTAEQAEDLMKVILKNGKRLRSLFVTSLTPTFSDSFIQSADTELPLLETVKVSWDHCPDREDSRSLFRHAPRLSWLHMTLPDIIFMDNPFSLNIPSNQLTTLHVHGFNPTHALYMLSLCPLLVEFDYSCECIPTALPNRLEALHVPVTLTRLERLRWTLKTRLGEEVDGLLLKSFAFPSLQELTWGAVIDDMEIEDCEPFFACLKNSLEVLNCYRAQTWESLDIWKKFDHISELRLSIDCCNSPGFKYSDGVDTLECLTLQPNQINLLPRLRSLYIFFNFSPPPADNDDDDDNYEDESSLEFAITYLLYSRRRTAIAVDLVDNFNSLDFDPSSDHWQRYQRLEKFQFAFSDEADDDLKFDWDVFDDFIREFEEVTRDAKVKRTLSSFFEIVW
ncbi:hypothetical protein AGABI1DRAFT_126593 [Agaricus bisporus var. burnettii JB137-S8]|uniref:Uncharacterized protein n=1 Tax=Agaricus bisporus var. burnettii (strain JB137-S8 / ATCC MYA-4627 / FGSC 10392) TaxID=597362 RepID=K5XFS2_AGABU|nr:uncharacterized protein AGABI1DRAFT_126593 [Agaricus bisporus var. burnettii JB137-S8]EKM82263.1 hypothetical protein AGABI1DRAFT_126593 [Agaricus bisporus var. burnettii JB137-S8]